MTQPEALRLADFLEDVLHDWTCAHDAAAELRRLYADNEKKSEAIQRLWKERDELRDSNEAKADRIDRLGETVEKLKAQLKPLPPQSPCEMTQSEGKMFKLGWLECEAAHGIKGDA